MKKTSYLKVKKWFLTTFPEIDEYKQERKETWKVIDKNAKELKEQKAKVKATMPNAVYVPTILS